jgi:tetratricopeptide (TPR) repeat protein
MRLRRGATVILVGAGVSIITIMVGLVTNLASSQTNWPRWLKPLQHHPWLSFVILATVAVGLTIALGIASDPTTKRQVHGNADEPVPSPPLNTAMVMRTLPRDAPTFTNRVTELQRVLDIVSAADAGDEVMPIHAIDGMPGMGKTAFAIHIGHLLISSFPDGQLFINLNGHTAGLHPVDPNDALAALLLADGVTAQQIPTGTNPATVVQARAAMWRSRLADRKMLVILDNVATYTQVEPLFPGEGRCLVLVTSRRRLAILDGVTLQMDALSSEDAVALFMQLARRRPAGLDNDIKEIVRLCGYLPLAISLLAAQLRHHPGWTTADLKARLLAAQNRLGEIHIGDRAVTAAFDLSYEGLDEKQQCFFRRLGLFPGGELDAYVTAAINDINVDEARQRLDRLYDDHFLDENGASRYRLHDLLREYAKTLSGSVDEEERAAILQRLRDYYLDALGSANRFLNREGYVSPPTAVTGRLIPVLHSRAEALDWLADERSNIIAVIQWVNIQGDVGSVLQLTPAVAPFLRHAGPWDQAAQLHRTAADAAMEIDDRGARAEGLANLGVVCRLMATYPAASAALEESLQIYRALHDRGEQAYVLNQLGIVSYLMSKYVSAEAEQREALAIYQDLEDRPGIANALADLGMVCRQTSRYEEAAQVQTEALEIYRDIGDVYGQANSLRDLGIVQCVRGQYATAAQFHSEAYELYKLLADRLHQAYALNEIGYVRRLRGELSNASEAHTEALALYRELGDKYGQANSLRHLGTLRRLAGDWSSATRLQEEARTIFRDLGSRDGEAHTSNEMGVLQRLASDVIAATASFEQAIELFRDIGDRWGEAEALNNWGSALNHAEPTTGMSQFTSALEISRDIGCPLEEAHALNGIGRCLLGSGQSTEAMRSLEDAASILDRLGVPEMGK